MFDVLRSGECVSFFSSLYFENLSIFGWKAEKSGFLEFFRKVPKG